MIFHRFGRAIIEENTKNFEGETSTITFLKPNITFITIPLV